MSKNLTLLNVIEKILDEADRPQSSKEILDTIKNQYKIQVGGNPIKTINARLTEEIKQNGRSSLFMRTGRGVYTLRKFTQHYEYIPEPIKRKYSIEFKDQVLVFPRELLDSFGYFHTIRKDYNAIGAGLLFPGIDGSKVFWKNRHDAEEDFFHKQVVTYVIVKYNDSILRFSRGKWTSLRDNLGAYTIGFGGHVEFRDVNIFTQDRIDDFETTLYQSVKRELKEEIGINFGNKNIRLIGVLNDDSVKQGEQHFAFIYLVEIFSPEVYKSEKWINKPHFISVELLVEEFKFYEYWSQLCIQAYWGEQANINCQIQTIPNLSLKDQSEIVLVVGYIGSGKTKICELLENKFSYKSIRCSRIMQELIGCGTIEEIGRQELQDAGYKFITEDSGHEKLSQGIINFMNQNPSKYYVLDGLRYPETFDVLSKKLDKPITIIYIDSLIENLHHNYRDRHKKRISFQEYLNTVSHPVEKAIQRFRPIADVTVHNNGSLSSYLATLDKFFENEMR